MLHILLFLMGFFFQAIYLFLIESIRAKSVNTIYEISHNEELMKEVNEKLEDRKLNEIEYQAINYLFKVIKDNEADYKKRLERKLDNLITIEKNTRIKDL